MLTLATNLLTEGVAEDALNTLEYELATWLDEATSLKGGDLEGDPVWREVGDWGMGYQDEIIPLMGWLPGKWQVGAIQEECATEERMGESHVTWVNRARQAGEKVLVILGGGARPAVPLHCGGLG